MNIEISEEIKNLIPYQPGKPLSEAQREYGVEHFVKLASNECPIPPSVQVLEAIQRATKEVHRYPDPGCFELRQKAAQYYGVKDEQLVFGNGSNELIDLLIRGFCQPGDSIATSESAFIAYRICAQAASVKTLCAPLKAGYRIDLESISERIEKSWTCPKIIFIPNPNNPTGAYVNQKEVQDFLDRWGQREDFLIVFDEAYTEFVRASDYPFHIQIENYKNVVLLKTLSKVFALAGLRLGVMIAGPFVRDIINRIRNPFNVNTLAQVAAAQSLQDKVFLKEIQNLTWSGLDYISEEMRSMGLSFVPSQANFIFFDTGRDALQVNEDLLKKGVILRPVVNYGFPQHLRFSVGLESENKKAIRALKEVIG